MCETSGLLSNWWRACRLDPDGTAKWLTWPTDHLMLEARRRYLWRWRENRANSEKLADDESWFDAKAAGIYAWVLSQEIGPFRPRPTEGLGGRPAIVGGSGSPARGAGVQVQSPAGQMPHIYSNLQSGQGVQTQKREFDETGERPDRDAWKEHQAYSRDRCRMLSNRLLRTYILHCDWSTAVRDSVLCQGDSQRKPITGILLDPPYRTDGNNRRADLYESDSGGRSTDAAIQAYRWAAAHGSRYRIVYCCRLGDFALPPSWKEIAIGFPGVRDPERRKLHRDCLMISPAALEANGQATDAPVGPLGLL